MSKKVKDIANELHMESKELLEKISAMGINALNEESELSDMDEKAVTNWVIHSRKKSETTIVKVASKKTQTKKEENKEVKIEVKRAPVTMETRKTAPKAKKEKTVESKIQASAGKTATPPAGTPMPKAVTPQAGTGKAAVPPMGVPMPKAASVQAPVGTPLPKSESMQNEKTAEEPVIEAPKAESAAKAEKMKTAVDKAVQGEKPQEKEIKKEVKQEAVPAEDFLGERFGVKIISRAADQKEEPKPASAAKPAAEKKDSRNDRNDRTDRPKRSDRDASKDRAARQNGRRNDGFKRSGDKDKDDEPVRQSSPRQKKSSQNNNPGLDISGMQKPNRKRDRKDNRDEDNRSVESRLGRKEHRGLMEKKSMEKPALKKSHKKEKVVEPESSINMEELAPGTKVINVPITVKGLSEQIDKSTTEIIMALMKMGVMANINQNIDEDTAILLGDELGVNIVVDKVAEEETEQGLELFEDKEEDLQARPPIITVMGHVDHGKTSLLDAIRKTNVTTTESGGITQHIGASEVTINGQKIVFLDTPGHEAFTAMRARGAHVTDIAVLVVAADDSVKPQTIESISHAKAAGVPIIVAINKMDKESANPDRVKQDLTEHGILVEEWGGDVICVPVSAKTGEGIVNLLEMILLQAEVLELKANPNRLALGTVIEARLDKAKGPVATLLVLNGTLQTGMSVVAGTCSGRIRAMTNWKGAAIRKAGPATAVEILGLTEVPEAGDDFNAVKEDKVAREIAENRKQKVREEVMQRNSSVSLEQLFSQIQEGEVKELNLIIKADVMGSVGALVQALEKLQNENVKVRIIHSGVGTVNESDVMLANTSGAVIIGFNVRPSAAITSLAAQEDVEIRTYRIIYEVIDDVEAAMKGMLDPVFKEVVLGQLEIRNTFKVPGVGIIGGAYVLDGKVQRNAQIRLVRDGIVIHEGKISSLKRFKDDAKEVLQGYECGVGIENYNDIKEGDIVEAFTMEEIERK